ncbi:protein NLRC3-like [Acropora muricata]|uniref:protein NLRC3-like n=1 Tax=Acropora muricata TaxID=159855 RepID=UPI0034E4D17B
MGHVWSKHGNVTGGFCPPFQEYKKPPQLSIKLKEAGDVPKSTETWRDDHLPIDILLLAVGSCDFLSCFSFLGKPFKSYKKGIGYVYFGGMGDASDLQQLKIALITSATGAATPGGSLTAVLNAVRVLGPKAAFLVGTCLSLSVEKVRMGDVVISSKLTAEGLRTPVSPLLCRLIQDAPYGWVAPLENPDELKVTVHCNGDILSQSQRKNCRCDDICEQYPGAVAIETEGIGVYAAAYDANIEWVIVKGVGSYFHQSQPATSEWMSFASTMAASVVAKMLKDPRVFLEWPHYNQDEISDLKEKRPHQGSHTLVANHERFVQRIRGNYKSAVLCPFPWCEHELQFKLADIFTRLQIVSKTRERSKLTDSISMTDIFRPHAECENPRVVLIEGNPAMGKTTYCRKLAHDWSLSRIPSDSWFPKVEMLLLLKCRDMNVGIANIQEAIDDQLLPEDVERSEKENFFSFIRNYQSRILLVLDGLDELKNEDLLLPLIQGKVLSDVYLLLTARPEMGARVRLYCDSLLHIVGYSKGDAISYIEQYFRNHSNPSLAKKLKDELAVNNELNELTSSPMNTALLCLLCEETNGMFPTKQTELYDCLVSCAIRRYYAKRGVGFGKDDPSERCREQLNQLGQVAFEALLKNRLYFSEEEMRSETVLQLFFVTCEPSRSKMKPTECYAFTHKTFQEYFAALYLANEVLTYSKESEALLLKVSPVDNWQVWKFLFPMVAKKDDERAVFLVSCLGGACSRHSIPEVNDITETTQFKNSIEQGFHYPFSPKLKFYRPLHDVTRSSSYIAVDKALQVIADCGDFEEVLDDCQREMLVKLGECIPLDYFEMFRQSFRSLLVLSEYLSGSCTLTKLKLNGSHEDRSSRGLIALAQALQTNCVLTHLDLRCNVIAEETAVALGKALESNTTLTYLDLTNVPNFPNFSPQIGLSGALALARALLKNSTLKCLFLGYNYIGDLGALAFADALRTNSSLLLLDLSDNGIGDLGTEVICKALQSNHVMTHLSLHGNTIGDSGAEALAGELQSPSTQLSYLHLDTCQITSLGGRILAVALQTNQSLTHLCLSANNLCSATALAEALQLNRTLTHLDLSQSNISVLGTEVIFKALQSNQVMTHLMLGCTKIGDSGAVALAEALKSPATQLSYLDLSWCDITSLGVEILAGALQTNRSLTHLSLAATGISCSGTAMAEALQLNRTLTHLDLSGTQISNTGAIQLAQTLLDKNNTLAYLNLIQTYISAEGKAKFELVNGKRCVISLDEKLWLLDI